jgi:hypothetical protein
MGLAAAVVVFGVAASVIAARRPTGFVDVSSPPEVFLAIPLLGLLQYAVFAVLAYLKRGSAQAHKRLMLLASLSILSAAIIRWPVNMIYAPSPLPGFGYYDLVALAYLLPLVAWDLTTLKRIHPVTLYGGLVLIAMVPIIGLVSQSAAWLAFANWLIGA